MVQNRLFERIGIALAVLMSAAALGLSIQQRGAAVAPAGVPPPLPGNTTPLPSQTTADGKLMPLPVDKDGKEVLAKGKDLIRMQGIVGGRKLYQLTAQRLVLTRDDSSTTVEGIQGTMLLGQGGKPSASFTAERAVMNMQTKDLQVQGQIHLESLDPKNKVAFQTREMLWDAGGERLTCPNPVEVTQPGVLLRGSSMVADARLKRLSLDGGVYLEADAAVVEKNLGVGGGTSAAGKGGAKTPAGTGRTGKGGR